MCPLASSCEFVLTMVLACSQDSVKDWPVMGNRDCYTTNQPIFRIVYFNLSLKELRDFMGLCFISTIVLPDHFQVANRNEHSEYILGILNIALEIF
jgi:hypothetical protein